MSQETHVQAQTDAFVKHCRFVHHMILILTIGVILVSIRVASFDPRLASAEAGRLRDHLDTARSLVSEIANSQNIEQLYGKHAGICVKLELKGLLSTLWDSTPSTMIDAIEYAIAIEDEYAVSAASDIALTINEEKVVLSTERVWGCSHTKLETSPATEAGTDIGASRLFKIPIPKNGKKQSQYSFKYWRGNQANPDREVFQVEVLVERNGMLPRERARTLRRSMKCSNSAHHCFRHFKSFAERIQSEHLEDAINVARSSEGDSVEALPLPGGVSIPLEGIGEYGELAIVLLQWFLAFHLLFQYSTKADSTIPWIGVYSASGARLVFQLSLIFPCLALYWLWDGRPPNYTIPSSFFASLLCLKGVWFPGKYKPRPDRVVSQ